MADIFSLVGRVSIEYAQAETALERVSDAAEDTADSLEDVGDASEEAGGTTEKSGNRMTSAFKKIGAAVVAAFAVDKIVDFGKSLVDASATVAAEQSAFEQIMGDYSDTAQQKMNEVADTTGMVSTRLTPYMTSMTAKFKGLGYDIDDATTLAQDGLTLAADAAAFWDKSLEDSMGALNSFINGSYEGGEAIGLFANDTQLASYAVKQGIVSETKEWANLDEAKKQATRLEYAQNMMEASGATGQAAKEADQYANVQANLNEKWKQFKAQIGEPVLQNVAIPAMDKLSGLVDKLSGGFDRLKNSSNVVAEMGKMFSEFVAKAQEAIPQVVSKVSGIMGEIGDAIKDNFPSIAAKGLDMVDGFVDTIAENLPKLIQAGVGMLKNIAQGIANTLPVLIEKVPTIVSKIANLINDNAPTILMAGVNIIVTLGKGLINAIPTLIANIPQIIKAIWDAFTAFNWLNLGKTLISGIKNGVTNAGEGLKNSVKNIFENIKNTVKDLSNSAKNVATNIWNGLKSGVSGIANGLKNFIVGIWNGIKSMTSSIFEGVKSIATTIWNGIKSAISSVVNGVKNTVSSVWNGIKSTTSNVFESIKGTATSVWNAIKNAITNPIETAKNAVKSAIDKMKSFFNFSWSLPKLKLPHIDISGKFSINPPSVPKFGIEWYKDGGIITDPTMFGFNGFTGKAMVGGEAGAEAIAPIDVLLGYVRTAVQEENAGLAYQIEKLIKMLEYYLPEVLKNMLKNIYLDTGVLVGELGGEIDNKLGNISKMKERGM